MMKKYFIKFLIFFCSLFLVSCGGGSSGAIQSDNVQNTPPPSQDGSQHIVPFTVKMLAPANGTTDVSLNPNIRLQFNVSVKNLNSTDIALHEGSEIGRLITIGQITAGDANTYTFSPAETLNPLTTYYMMLGSEIVDTAGVPLVPTKFIFTTGDFT